MKSNEIGKIKLGTFILASLFLMSGTIVAYFIAFDNNRPDYYKYLWMLPLFFGLFLFFFSVISKNFTKNISTLAIIGVFSIRNILTPFIMFLGRYNGMFKFLNQENVNKGIILMLFESVVLIIYASHALRKFARQDRQDSELLLLSNNRESSFFFLFIIFISGMWVIRPDYFSGYSNILENTSIRLNTTAESAHGAFFTLFTIIIPISYLFIAIYLLKFVNRRKSRFSSFRALTNIAIICIPFLFMSNSDGFTLVSIVSLAIISYRSGGINKRIFFTVFGIGGIAVFLYILLLTASLSHNSSDYTIAMQLSSLFQAYFPGVCNFGGFFNISNYDKIETLFYDIYFAIPFRNTLFGVLGDKRLVLYYTIENEAVSQIIPCVCQIYYYLWLFAPFIECFYINGAIKAYSKSTRCSNVYTSYAYVILFAYLTLTPIMYNTTIFLTRFLSTILPLLVFSYFLKNKNLEIQE